MEKKNKNKRKSSPELMASAAWCTSREKAIPGTPKWLIPDAFWFASDLYMPAVMLTAGEFCSSPGIIFLPLAHLACAPGITYYP
jgi:hypothetical protein